MLLENIISGILLSIIVAVPLTFKWELEKKIVIPAAVLIGLLSAFILQGAGRLTPIDFRRGLLAQLFLILSMSAALLLWRFYRDPERVPPHGYDMILSPADGRIIYLKEIKKGEIPFSEKNGRTFPLAEFVQCEMLPSGGYVLGIAMNFLDVHVNRAPIQGKVSLLKHIKGLFISLKQKEAIIQNERVLTIIENDFMKIGIVQIASRLVRKITPYIDQGLQVAMGQRIGTIRFGSQVDLILPKSPNLVFKVKVGEKVKAGLSVVAILKK